jgi:uncharacterized protein YjiS (DUF1127 family)
MPQMNTTYSTTGFAQTTASTRRVSSAFKNFWDAFQEWRKWERLRADLCNLNERELMDIGITRGEIDYVASRQTHSRHDVDVSYDTCCSPPRQARNDRASMGYGQPDISNVLGLV